MSALTPCRRIPSDSKNQAVSAIPRAFQLALASLAATTGVKSAAYSRADGALRNRWPHEHARTQSPEVCCIMRGQPSTRCEWLAWLKRIVARCPVYPEAFGRRPTHHPFKFTEERTP